ncbi:MAG: hypothetical protein AAF456_19810 [Planctomycetota bacterium]
MARCQFTYNGTAWEGPKPTDAVGCNISIGVTANTGTTIEVDCSTDPPTLVEVIAKTGPPTATYPFPAPTAGQSVLQWQDNQWKHIDGDAWTEDLKFQGSDNMRIILEAGAEPRIIALDWPDFHS